MVHLLFTGIFTGVSTYCVNRPLSTCSVVVPIVYPVKRSIPLAIDLLALEIEFRG